MTDLLTEILNLSVNNDNITENKDNTPLTIRQLIEGNLDESVLNDCGLRSKPSDNQFELDKLLIYCALKNEGAYVVS